MKKRTRKISINYPLSEYEFLKLATKKQKISIQKFIINSVLDAIDRYEDELWILKKKSKNKKV